MLGLMVRTPWIDQILAGDKVWEIRGSNTHVRGTIGLIRSGSGRIYGVCELIDVVGPLTHSEMLANTLKHREPPECLEEGLPYATTYAWVLANARAFSDPVPYKHPSGAIIWVKLPDGMPIECETSPQDLTSYSESPRGEAFGQPGKDEMVKNATSWSPLGL